MSRQSKSMEVQNHLTKTQSVLSIIQDSGWEGGARTIDQQGLSKRYFLEP
jgi:hypothetical protein